MDYPFPVTSILPLGYREGDRDGKSNFHTYIEDRRIEYVDLYLHASDTV